MFAGVRTVSVAAALVAPLVLAGPAAATHDANGPHARSTDDSCPPAQVPPAHFSDVPGDNPHALGIDCVAWWDVTAGRSVSSYDPSALITREQMATFLRNLIVASGGALPTPSADHFTDDEDSLHEESINALAEAGVVSGCGGGRFEPRAAVDRGQMATFLVNAYEYRSGTTLPPPSADVFSDDDGTTHEASINKAATAGFAAGVGGASYDAISFVRRDHMASFLSRVLDLLVEDAFAQPPAARPGDFDLTFGDAGTTSVSFGDGYAEAHDVAVDRDGSIALAGRASRAFTVVRLKPDGTPEPAFDGDGKVTTPIGTFALANSVVVQDDGKVVAAGHTNPTAGSLDADFALARYNLDGSLDTTFGDGGIVTTSFPGAAYVTELVLQPDGALVAAGTSSPETNGPIQSDFALARYLPDGRLDPAFGERGQVVSDLRSSPDFLDALVLQPDGKLVAGGTSEQADPDAPSDLALALVRYRADGTLDTSFGAGAKTFTDTGGRFETLSALALQSDGSLVGAGEYVTPDGTKRQVLVVRHDAAGKLDTTFGDDGVVVTSPAPQSEASGVTVDGDDRIVVVGPGVDGGAHEGKSWVVVRYLPDGALDESFGEDGVVRSDIGRLVNAVEMQRDGRIVAAGCDCPSQSYYRGGFESKSSFVVARFLSE